MSARYQKTRKKTIDSIMGHFKPGRISKSRRAMIERFMHQCLSSLPLQDLQALPPKPTCDRLMESWHYVEQKNPNNQNVDLMPPVEQWPTPNRSALRTLNNDKPFLVDSITLQIQRLNYELESLLHPVLFTKRGSNGKLLELAPEGTNHRQAIADGYAAESFMDLVITAPADAVEEKNLIASIARGLEAVHAAVRDWPTMCNRTDEAIEQLRDLPASIDMGDLSETVAFLEWLKSDHYIFLGSQDFLYEKKGKQEFLVPQTNDAIGICSLPHLNIVAKGKTPIPPESLYNAGDHELVAITKSDRRSVVHRPVHLDVIRVRRYNNKGDITGERHFYGMFTSLAYFTSASNIPILRKKIEHIIHSSQLHPSSHDGKALVSILETYPRDELFQASESELFHTCMGILALEATPRACVFSRKDRFERFVSAMVFLPKERFSTDLRLTVQSIIEDAFQGTVTAYYTQVTDSPLARIHMIVKTKVGHIPNTNMDKLNRKIEEATSAWQDGLREALTHEYGNRHGEQMFRHYSAAFPDIYAKRYSSATALIDLDHIEEAITEERLAVNLAPHAADDGSFRLKFYNHGEEITLSDIVPVLEHMGLRVINETPFLITPSHTDHAIWIRDVKCQTLQGSKLNLEKIAPLFEEALLNIWSNSMENDGLNALVIGARMGWRDVVMLRSYVRYLKQLRFAYNQDAIEEALASHPALAAQLVALFHARFNPSLEDHDIGRQESIMVEIEHTLSKVTSITTDRIIRRLMEVINATLRTNFFQTNADGTIRPCISIKMNTSLIPEAPKPHPHAEIFVYATHVEGVHLRGGKVARGGLRWSDRHEDYRTEILGLMKAQMVKNAVIVPEGAKGGFVVRNPVSGADRDAFMAQGISCYKDYLGALLDITDNLIDGSTIPPTDVIRHDGDDPYLVVAADKGTATFSDTANGVAIDYGFWLGDAFASGGSVGYDHKGMGITARGAWVSVERHFSEMGKDPERDDMSVVGIGDMSGDVFGNGMLLSKHIKLVGAFNHKHIFIDPNPDAAASFKERKRLFEMPRSGWLDYNKKLISRGGAIFERTAKRIKLSKDARATLGIDAAELTPDMLIQAMLKAPVDLLWNGGIGTYVKASDESNGDVGDHANDRLRVNGNELRCHIVGEGGNLGLTQRARIEYARHGGRINTDAIDNSAGVDCSDHEVNIKIALSPLTKSGALTEKKRNNFLASMTDEVAYLCLRDNFLQTQALTIAELQGVDLLESQRRVIRKLEREGLLDRALEFLPSDEEIDIRLASKQGLTRPELAVLLSYSKLVLYRDILQANLPDNPYFEKELIRYFPKEMRSKYADAIGQHQLRREIIATAVTNSIINRIGSTFFYQVQEDTGEKSCDVARGYVIARDVFSLRTIWTDIEALGSDVDVQVQANMFTSINQLVYHSTLWFLRQSDQTVDVAEAVGRFEAPVEAISSHIEKALTGDAKLQFTAQRDHLITQNVPKPLATKLALLPSMVAACDIAHIADNHSLPLPLITEIYFSLGNILGTDWLIEKSKNLANTSHWSRQATSAMISELMDQQRRLASHIVKGHCAKGVCDIAVDSWVNDNQSTLNLYHNFMDELRHYGQIDASMLIVALRRIENICPATA